MQKKYVKYKGVINMKSLAINIVGLILANKRKVFQILFLLAFFYSMYLVLNLAGV